MKLGKLKLDKNTWVIIGGAAAAVSAVVLLRGQGGGSSSRSSGVAADPYGAAPTAGAGSGGSAGMDPQLAQLLADSAAGNVALAAAVNNLSASTTASANTTHSEPAAAPLSSPTIYQAAPAPVSRPAYQPPPTDALPPATSYNGMIYTPSGAAFASGAQDPSLRARPVYDVAPFYSGAAPSSQTLASVAPSGTTGRVDSPGGAYLDPGLWSGAQGGGLHGLS